MDRFKTMETFVNIVRCGSLSKAARRLAVSRAIVTRHLQQLEEHLGARLFNRTTRQLSLTDIGERYYAACSKILAEADEADLSVSRQQSQPRGTLRLLAPPSFANMRLAPIIADFMVAYPNIQISMTVTSFSLRELDERNFDIAVYPTAQLPNIGLSGRKIGEAAWIICAAPKYIARHGEPKTPEDLAQHNCLWMRVTDPVRHWTFYKGKDKVDVPVSGSLVTNSVASVKAAVVAGVGISLLPHYSLSDELATGRIREILPEYRVASRPIYALYRYSRYLPNKVRVFIDFLGHSLSQDSTRVV